MHNQNNFDHFNVAMRTMWAAILMLVCSDVLPREALSLEHIYQQYLFYPEVISGYRSMNDGEHFTILEMEKEIISYDYRTGINRNVIFTTDWITDGTVSMVSDYAFSQDETRLLLTTQQEALYRYSFYSNYFVYDLETKDIQAVFSRGKQRLAGLSPDGNKVSFIYENNLYVTDMKTSALIQITYDGMMNQVINGAPDWVYEEEFALEVAYQWSPDSKRIAFYRFDETEVRNFTVTYFNDLYPEQYSYKYPKAGEKNAIVDIYVYDLEKGTTARMNTGNDPERYIPRIKWLPDASKICVFNLNRLQNELTLLLCDPDHGNSQIFYRETDPQFITEVDDHFVTFLPNSDKAIVKSERSGFMHLYQYSLDGSLENEITSGKWEVDKLLGVDEKNQELYFSSTEVSPLERHIYCVNLDGSGKRVITNEKGFNSAEFSTDYKYYLLTHSSAGTPPVFSIFDTKGDLMRIIEDNDRIKNNMALYSFRPFEFFNVVTENGDTLNAYKLLPPGNPKKKKYPVLIYVYGGPDSQEVVEKWNRHMAWFQLLAGKGYLIVCMDNRGTAGRGATFKKSTYLELGNKETRDQISLARYLGTLDYVDKNRIGVFGWSYGGYMSLLCLTRGSDYFKMGISVAPVTNWRYYDTVYSERFMRKPEDNATGYDNYSPFHYIDRLKGDLLLIHGMADDNVHMQHSVMFMNELIRQNKSFESEFYPNKNHHIRGGNTTYHLYQRMTNYILENL